MSTEIIESESTAVVVAQPQQAVSLWGAGEPVDVIAKATSVASSLRDVLKKQNLVSNISGKEYPRCEAWTLLGTLLGVFPVLQWVKEIEGGYSAFVQAKTFSGAVIGAAEADCKRSEKNWANRDDFALKSMAQTRATAKALRMPLGFVMSLAGYEATPAEELDAPGAISTAPQSKPRPMPATPPKAPVSAPSEAPKAKGSALGTATDPEKKALACKARFLQVVAEKKWSFFAWLHAVKNGWILDTERLEDGSPSKFPVTIEQFEEAEKAIKELMDRAAQNEGPLQEEQEAYDAAYFGDAVPYADPAGEEPEHEEWMDVVMPLGKQKGMKLGEFDRKDLFYWGKNYQPKPYKGKISDKDVALRKALDDALSWMDEHKGNPGEPF